MGEGEDGKKYEEFFEEWPNPEKERIIIFLVNGLSIGLSKYCPICPDLVVCFENV